ncbi:beta-ketoacyl-ACP synthase III [Desulfotalea psychrophila]|uniref:Beta-ketoacyl-[acyl-carrier-protein] synthase III n=1 Tax=Desulfotalea psychrophila (strain LSv54 / DSM 12343) TaxID=177439 RepID=FABH_DESPS|nr:beta-ketoacyl-ACP synthase III [Desulfotalea psychrophila]Q6AJF8.1 RecName: Full=Beta-ketoacyl-[acyl-carrier-protein] synthase III; Short=Beta-ketoacyl-ACP synthase III; Short=KAS III; AltName: Full=3-oxoacyl-[acyl-carrier-protein] synthase 3; AltName: Full=3-oxoacyl-[acyl-carrier-protein] synthase III [Desulfotalea psychrophila LSv54]CAG37522.1 probable 3-oxoacyl-[acyl-carrier-protein] synthase III [Desulfotalea psychrophila LSv54]
MSVVILGTGSCLPEKIVTNKDLEKIVETNDEWIRTRTGICERRIAGPGEQAYILASRAAKNALDAAGLVAEDLDMIVVGTISAHMVMPSCACMIQQEIGAKKAFAFDVNAACSGFLYAMEVGSKYVATNPAMKVLCIGTETLSARTNQQDRNTSIIFADGAGAAVIGYEEGDRGILASKLFSDGSFGDILFLSGSESTNTDLRLGEYEGSHIHMEGREVFKHAVRAMEGAVNTIMEEVGVSPHEIKLLIPHQANIRIIKNLGERLGLSSEQVFVNIANYGNTSAASVPIALDEAVRGGKIESGDLVLLCSFGGGFTWGASLIRW